MKSRISALGNEVVGHPLPEMIVLNRPCIMLNIRVSIFEFPLRKRHPVAFRFGNKRIRYKG